MLATLVIQSIIAHLYIGYLAYEIGMECVTDIIPVSFCSLKCQLSSDTKHFMFIHYKNDGNLQSHGFPHLIDL